MLSATLRAGRFVLAAGLLLGIVPAAPAAVTLHVAPNGNDANSGTESEPFATLEKARQAVHAINQTMNDDIVVLLHGGVYPIDRPIVFEPEDSGMNGHDVVYRAASKESPVVSGGKKVVGWTPDVKGRWKAPAPVDEFRQLYVGGVRAVRARSGQLNGDTNAGRWKFVQALPRGGQLKGGELIGNKGYRTTAVEIAGWRNVGDIEFCYFNAWSQSRCKVQSIVREGDRAVISMVQPYFSHARAKDGVQVGLPTFIENALELLDEPGEWYLDRPAKTVYYMPRLGEDMSKIEVIAPAVEKLVELRGTLDKPVEHLRFEGISFRHATWLRPNKIGHVDVQANFIVDSEKNLYPNNIRNLHDENLKSPANVICHAAKSIRFERCDFTQLGGAGLDIEFGSQGNIVSGCEFHDISGSAVQVGDILKDDHHPDDPRKIVKNNSVVNCYIHDCGVEYMSAVGIFAGYTEGTRLAHNEICRLPYSGISMGWGWGQEDAGGGGYGNQPHRYKTPTPAKNNRIEFNSIHNVMQPMDDGGGIYTLGNQPGSMIRGNHIHDNPGNPGGIYLDEGSGIIEITGNVVNRVAIPMNYNNAAQGRRATCNEHDNIFIANLGPFGKKEGEAKVIARKAGLEPDYRNLELTTFRREYRERPSRFPNDPEAFKNWQKAYRAKLAAWLMGGGFPARVPLDARVIETRDYPKFTLRRVEYHSQKDRKNTLLISLPKGVAKAPVLLTLHGHENAWGQAAENAYHLGDADEFCAYFAEHGWAVVQPATMNHALQHKGWTLQGEWTWDAMVALDYAATLPNVDMNRVAVCGLSTGAHLAMDVLALDDRVKAGVAGCILSTWNHYRLRLRIPPHCDCGILAQLGPRLEQCDWAALAAPKPVQFQQGRKDACFCPGVDPKLLQFDWNLAVMPPGEYETAFAEVQRAYRLAGKPTNTRTEFHDAGHRVDNAAAFRWLQSRIGAPASGK